MTARATATRTRRSTTARSDTGETDEAARDGRRVLPRGSAELQTEDGLGSFPGARLSGRLCRRCGGRSRRRGAASQVLPRCRDGRRGDDLMPSKGPSGFEVAMQTMALIRLLRDEAKGYRAKNYDELLG